jgi:N6-adenosine-specific RNA methylase IME4
MLRRSSPIIESCSPGPYIKLFARGDRQGWDMWGTQADAEYELTWNTYKNHTAWGVYAAE